MLSGGIQLVSHTVDLSWPYLCAGPLEMRYELVYKLGDA